jgi:serine/threonine protein kinase
MAEKPSEPPPTPTPRSPAAGGDGYDTDPPPGVTPGPGGSTAGVLLAAGERPLPEYELVQRLGRGGFGEVWKARGPGGFAVALKFIRLDEKVGVVERRALDLMKDIRHPHLLDQFGAWEKDDFLILAMQLADGSLLDQLLQATTTRGLSGIPLPELLEHIGDAARGIDYLNSVGIVHRDIKPHNLLLVGGGVKVADFGLARVLERTAASSSRAMTASYAAPEVFDGHAGDRSDQYALAVSYCHLRANRLPFEGGPVQVMAAHLMNPPDLSMLPEVERQAVARALAKKPPERWPSCRAFVDALKAGISGTPIQTPVLVALPSSEPSTKTAPRQELPKLRPASSRGIAVPIVIALLILSLIGIMGVLLIPLAGLFLRTPTASPEAPQGALSLASIEPVSLKAGERGKVSVRVRRLDYDGPIELHWDGLPAGVSSAPNSTLPSKTDSADFELKAEETAVASNGQVRLVASGGGILTETEFRLTIVRPLPPAPEPAKKMEGTVPVDAAAILDRAINALGGEELLAKAAFASWKSKGTFTFMGNDSAFTNQQTVQGLDHYRQEFEGEFGGTQIKGLIIVTGDKGWRKNGDNVEDMDGDAIMTQKRIIYLTVVGVTVLPLKTREFKVETLAEETIEGKLAAGIKATGPDGKDFKLFFDKQTSLPIKLVAKVPEFTGGEYLQETTFAEYKQMGGILKATKISIKKDGEKYMEQEFTEFKMLDKVAPETFAKPK